MTDDLQRLFDAERAVRAPTGELERGLGRLLTDVARGAAPLPVAASSLKLGLSVVSKWLVVGFIAGLGGAGAASQIWAPNAVAAPNSTNVPQALAVVAPVGNVETPVGAAATVELNPQPAPPRTALAAHPERAPSAPSVPEGVVNDARLSEELRLIAAAKRELELHHPQLAAAWLSEHAARFPGGAFATDREALRVLVRCSQHKEPHLAEQFAATHPSSPVVERLVRACTPVAASASSNVDFPKVDK